MPSRKPSSDVPNYAPVVHVYRGAHVESAHYGGIVMADSQGRILRAFGDPDATTFLRSSAKPFQLAAVIASGAADHFALTPRELAVATASHNAEDRHLEAVSSILSKIGLTEQHLLCGMHEPLGAEPARKLRKSGRRPTPLHSNCSGKHAAMLALAVHRGWSPEAYTERDHPVQQEMAASVAAFGGVAPGEMIFAVDGCTVPTFGISLREAATAYARLMEPAGLPASAAEAAGRVVTAMRAHPEMVGGEGVIDTELMRLCGSDLVAKRGAEGFYGIGFRREGCGIGIAFKIADGDLTGRARDAVTIEVVHQLGLASRDALAELEETYLPPITNRRDQVVGRLEACFSII